MEKLLDLICFLGVIAVVWAEPRIVGGEEATETQFPHQIALQIGEDQKFHCSGSILSELWCVTAAHCVEGNSDPNYYTVAAGSNIYKNLIKYDVNRVVPHENYKNFMKDIALIELKQPLAFSATLNKIAIYKGIIEDGARITISGWGRIFWYGPLPKRLQFNDKLIKLSTQTCKDSTGDIYYDGLYCFGHSIGNGACNGDSGGPAHYQGLLVGVTNFGTFFICGSTFPDGYCNIAYFIPWINEKVGYEMV